MMWLRIFFIITFFPAIVLGRLCEVNTRDNFWIQVNRSSMAVIQLYWFDRHAKDGDEKANYIFAKNRLKAISQNSRLSYASLDFISVNCAACPILQNELSVTCFPTILVSINGIPRAPKLTGFANESDIIQFIERTIGSEIDNRVEQHNEHDQKVEDAQLAAYANCCCYPNYWCGPWASWGCGPCFRSWNWCW